MDKVALKKKLIELERDSIKHAEANYEEFISSNTLDESDVVDYDDQAHQHQSANVSKELDHQIHEHTEHLKTLDKIDFSPTDIVQPGAVVKTNNRYMVVAVSKPKFKFGDQTMIGISIEAPIYSYLEGKKVGDVCEFNNIKFEIQEVY